MAELPVPTYEMNRFTWDRATRTLTAEASSLAHGMSVMSHLYDNAANVGLAIRSDRTQRVVRFSLANVRRDADQDVQAWEFLPEDRTLRVRVVVFND